MNTSPRRLQRIRKSQTSIKLVIAKIKGERTRTLHPGKMNTSPKKLQRIRKSQISINLENQRKKIPTEDFIN